MNRLEHMWCHPDEALLSEVLREVVDFCRDIWQDPHYTPLNARASLLWYVAAKKLMEVQREEQTEDNDRFMK